MPNPDRERSDQDPADQPTENANNEDEPQKSGHTRTRAHVKPPAGGHARRQSGDGATPGPPAFVLKGGAKPDPEVVDGPRIDPALGLGWLEVRGSTEAAGTEQAGAPPGRTVRPPRKPVPHIHADLVGKQQIQGKHAGDRYVRVVRQHSDDFERAGPGHLVATEEAMEARGSVGRTVTKIKRTLIGQPLTTSAAAHERLTKVKALAVLSSDALSSVAYATEEICGSFS